MGLESSLIILTFNEIEGVRALFERIPFTQVSETLVIDGGSTDGTGEFFLAKGIPVIVQDRGGRGEAFKLAARQAGGEKFVFFSPDGNEDPADIPKLLALLSDCDMAIASRFLKGAANEEDGLIFPWRAWANRAFGRLANLAWNRGDFISDTINGFRAVKKSAFERMHIDAGGFSVEYQMSIRAMKLGLKVKEIPTHEGRRIGGRSQARSLPTGLSFLGFFAKELLQGRNF